MKNRVLLYAFMIQSITFLAQEKVIEFEHYLNVDNKKVRYVHAFPNENNDGSLLMFEDNTRLTGYAFDSDFKEIGDGLTIKNPLYKYPNISGISYGEKGYTIFLGRGDNKRWAALYMDFEKRSSQVHELFIKYKKEKFLNAFVHKNIHYVVTLLRESSTIRLYMTDVNGSTSSKEYDLSHYDFSSGRRRINNLYRLMRPDHEFFKTSIIENNTPISLSSVNSNIQLYPKDGHLVITVNRTREYVHIINLDLASTTASVTVINKPQLDDHLDIQKANTFLDDNHLFTLTSSYDELLFTIIDIDTKEVIKRYHSGDREDISFKNTPIIQEGGAFDDYRELERTQQFLRKVTSSYPAISVYKTGAYYIVTMGASKEIKNGGPIIFASIGGSLAVGIIAGIVNTTLVNYWDYTRTKTTRIKTVLDQNFNHIADMEIPENTFDRIRTFENSLKETMGKKMGTNTLMLLSRDYIYGAYNKESQTLSLYRFNE